MAGAISYHHTPWTGSEKTKLINTILRIEKFPWSYTGKKWSYVGKIVGRKDTACLNMFNRLLDRKSSLPVGMNHQIVFGKKFWKENEKEVLKKHAIADEMDRWKKAAKEINNLNRLKFSYKRKADDCYAKWLDLIRLPFEKSRISQAVYNQYQIVHAQEIRSREDQSYTPKKRTRSGISLSESSPTNEQENTSLALASSPTAYSTEFWQTRSQKFPQREKKIAEMEATSVISGQGANQKDMDAVIDWDKICDPKQEIQKNEKSLKKQKLEKKLSCKKTSLEDDGQKLFALGSRDAFLNLDDLAYKHTNEHPTVSAAPV